MADRFSGLDISYDDKRWGNIIDPGEWNQNFHEIEDWVNALVTDLNNGILTTEDVQELFDEFSETFAKTEDVDEMLSSIQTAVNEKVSKSGDTLTGALTLSGDPTNPLHAATKQYVDDNKLQNVKDGTNTSVLLGDIENNVASGYRSVAEGNNSQAEGQYSHAEGMNTLTQGYSSHAEGASTYTGGLGAHAEGSLSKAYGNYSHAEGNNTKARGDGSHTEGNGCEASGSFSHAEGLWTEANHESQHVFGRYNIPDDSTNPSDGIGNYVEIVGNGSPSQKANARTLDWNGNEWLAGKLTVGANPTNNMDVATKQYVDNLVGNIQTLLSSI